MSADDTFEPIPLDAPWCPGDRPYPATYDAARAQDPNQCVAVDPCGPDGTTLWHVTLCESTIPVVAQSAPPAFSPNQELPATGIGLGWMALFAAVAISLGLIPVFGLRRKPERSLPHTVSWYCDECDKNVGVQVSRPVGVTYTPEQSRDEFRWAVLLHDRTYHGAGGNPPDQLP